MPVLVDAAGYPLVQRPMKRLGESSVICHRPAERGPRKISAPIHRNVAAGGSKHLWPRFVMAPNQGRGDPGDLLLPSREATGPIEDKALCS